MSGTGTQNAALSLGGSYPTTKCCVEEYDGMSWTTQTGIGVPLWDGFESAMAGTQNAAIRTDGANVACVVDFYNGTSWTIKPPLAIPRFGKHSMAGTQNAALVVGGDSPTACQCVEEYTSGVPSTVNSTTGTRESAQMSKQGTQNDAFVVGGTGAYPANLFMETYNGTSWSSGANMLGSYSSGDAAGTTSCAIMFIGYSNVPSPLTLSCSYQYNGSTWSAGAGMNCPRAVGAGAGSGTAALAFGGSGLACTEEYND